MERVLILTMGFGTGHNAAAHALVSRCRNMPDTEALAVDLLELVPGTFHPFLQSGYIRMMMRFPSLYTFLYDRTSHSRFIRYVSSEFIEKTGWMIRKKLNHLLERFHPTRIISTHPFGFLMLPACWRGLPTTGVVTDYEVHAMWFAQAPDLLCIPRRLVNEREQKRLMWQTGCRILEAGIPSASAFHKRNSQIRARIQAGVSKDEPMVLVMGGGLGYGPLPRLVDELSRLKPPARIWVLTGKNEKLYRELTARFDGENGIHILRYRDDMPLLMDAADLLVTKPGGLTVTEAMNKGLPMLLFDALPGQEEANRDYLIRNGGALTVRPETVCKEAAALLAHPEERRTMARRLEELASPEAADRIVHESLRIRREAVLDSVL
ncbi:MGDG synthase family glycosyltransferase [Salinithrix halophila]|uniref:Glycosyltransferase n=1 Tax=Salinithrix halophila TaxID=1485204 RepID=A0ABV8JDT7_9BACL